MGLERGRLQKIRRRNLPDRGGICGGGLPDVSADGMIKICKEVSTDFSRIVPGAAVW